MSYKALKMNEQLALKSILASDHSGVFYDMLTFTEPSPPAAYSLSSNWIFVAISVSIFLFYRCIFPSYTEYL